ncbi:MAG: DUF3501 family protein [Gemmataceae bacterium]
MDSLTLDDILPLEEFAARRREYFAGHARYLDRYRRVRLGPRATLLFENRQTLWFRLQEILRVARLADPARVRQELEVYNRLLPQRDRLQAALLLHLDDSRLEEELTPWRDLRGDQLVFHVAGLRYPANLLTCRPEDRCIGTAHWVQFVVDAAAQAGLAQGKAHFQISLPDYTHSSGLLSEDVCRSLLEDLTLSARAAG